MLKWRAAATAIGEAVPHVAGAALARRTWLAEGQNTEAALGLGSPPHDPGLYQCIQPLKIFFIATSHQPLPDPTETGNKVAVGFLAWGLECEWGAGVTCVREDTSPLA